VNLEVRVGDGSAGWGLRRGKFESESSRGAGQAPGGATTAPEGAVAMRVTLDNYMNSGWFAFDDVCVSAFGPTSYYYAGSTRVAMRKGIGTGADGLTFLFGDRSCRSKIQVSNSVNANSAGVKTSGVRYKAWGEDRYTSGSTPISFRFTGQRVEETRTRPITPL
jgi:hypothetical protein